MKRKCVVLTLMISLASMTSMPAIGNAHSGKPIATETQVQIATQKGPALVKSRIPKPKLFRTNPHRSVHFALIDDQDDIFISDDDLATGYRRRDLTKQVEDDAPLPENIRWRLFLARQMALLKYREIHEKA